MKTSHPIALFVLAICSFAIGTTEFVTTGLLPDIAHYFSISIPTAGFVTSGYALGVVVGAPLLTIATIRISRKPILALLMALFVCGSVVSAIANDFAILMVGRVLSALAQGAFFGIGAVVATSMVPPHRCAWAISMMFTGLTLANVLGVPLGTLLGQHYGWRSPFWIIAALGVLGILGILTLVPKAHSKSIPNLAKELAVFKRPQVWLALTITVIGFSGLLASFGYIAPMMTNVAGFSPSSIVWLLSLFGVGLVVGNILGGKAADWNLKATIYIVLALLAILLFLFVFTSHYKILAACTLFLIGVVGFGAVSPLQMHIMQKADGAPTLASAANIAAFNLGTSIGVFLGGVAIHHGLGYSAPNWVGGSLTLLGLILVFVTNSYTKKTV